MQKGFWRAHIHESKYDCPLYNQDWATAIMIKVFILYIVIHHFDIVDLSFVGGLNLFGVHQNISMQEKSYTILTFEAKRSAHNGSVYSSFCTFFYVDRFNLGCVLGIPHPFIQLPSQSPTS